MKVNTFPVNGRYLAVNGKFYVLHPSAKVICDNILYE